MHPQRFTLPPLRPTLATTIDVAGSTFTDGASNNNTAATQFNWTYDKPHYDHHAAEVSDGDTSSDASVVNLHI